MNQDTSIPKFNASTDEVSEMLGLNINSASVASTSVELPVSQSDLPVANLPVVANIQSAVKSVEQTTKAKTSAAAGHLHDELQSLESKKSNRPLYLRIILVVLPFAAIFVVGLFLYFFFFSSFNFGSIFNSKPAAQTPKQTAIQLLEQQDLAAFQSWMSGYYYEIRDPKLLDPEADNSGNGLSNFQKYLLNLNPKSYDTMGLNMADSQALSEGIDPSTGNLLSDNQKGIMSKYIDMEAVMNRLALANLQNQGQVAGINIRSNGTFVNSNTAVAPSQNQNQSQNQNSILNSSYPSVVSSNNLDINTSIPGRLEIPDLKINVPIIFSQDPKNFDQDLQIGVVHYPGTAMPGQIGTTYIAGHSSNYIWAKGDYNQIFSHLGDLGDNASFTITVVQKNGKNAILHYVVTTRKQYSPVDQSQFINTGKSLVALSTCWPVGSTAKRLVVFGQLVQVEK